MKMNVRNYGAYYLLLLLFPFSFLLHNVNQIFGLTGVAEIARLLVEYLLISFCIAFVSKLIFKQFSKAFVFSFILLVINFLFSVYKDVTKDRHLPAIISSYKFLLPLLLMLVVAMALYLRKSKGNFNRLSRALAFFLVINAAVETGWCLYNFITKADTRQDFGDQAHTVIKDLRPGAATRKPSVFWIIFDEYARSSSLRKGWGFSNPLDSVLQAKGFFVADSARSNYNFTHYSVTSMLDMVYLKNLHAHSVVGLSDLQRGALSIYDNNVVQVFEKNGYTVRNYSIFDLKGHPAQGLHMFDYVPRLLINFQTFTGRLQKDIGWNFPTMFQRNKPALDSAAVARSLTDLDTANQNLLGRCLQAVHDGAAGTQPSFYFFHFMMPHQPYMYNANGSIAFEHGYSGSPRYYIPNVQYTNTVINGLVDSILAANRGKDIAIILQGDHGFKFEEGTPLFEPESCKNFYAVYCSDGDYSPWYRSLSMVNSFRILFNKYFNARLKLLPDSSYNLYYR